MSGTKKNAASSGKMTGGLDLRKCILIDERGSHLAMTRLEGRAEPGERVFDKVPGDRRRTVSTLGARGLEGIRTGLSVAGAMDGGTRVCFVEERLAPTRNRGEVVFLEDCPLHQLEEGEEALEARGAWAIFLPRDSPDLNPRENCWSKVKAMLRSLTPRTREAFLEALVEACSSVTVQAILGWFNHCGDQAARI